MGSGWKYLDQFWNQCRYVSGLASADSIVDRSLFIPGSDMALAFLSHLVGPRAASVIRGQAEIVENTQDDDPFAALHGLV